MITFLIMKTLRLMVEEHGHFNYISNDIHHFFKHYLHFNLEYFFKVIKIVLCFYIICFILIVISRDVTGNQTEEGCNKDPELDWDCIERNQIPVEQF